MEALSAGLLSTSCFHFVNFHFILLHLLKLLIYKNGCVLFLGYMRAGGEMYGNDAILLRPLLARR